jgi:hypothetical protein
MVLCTGGLYFLVMWVSRWRRTGDLSSFAIWYVCGSALGVFACGLLLLEFVTWLQQFDLGYRNNRGSYLNAAYISRLLPPWAYEYKRVEQTMYVGLLMTILAAVSVVRVLARLRRPSELPVFGLLLLIVSFGLVFGLWPMWLVGWFPGMGFNSWSRAICIMDIALITLGACAIDRVWKLARQRPSRALQVAVMVIAVAQVGEMAAFFRRYNGPVPDRYYYPEIPATRYLQQHAGPFDYVISDRSFDISGELGAYGLREWFAHQFRTPAQKRALDQMVPEHAHSHTASRFRAREIDTGSQALIDFNARYLVVSSHDPRAKGPGSRKWPSHEPLPPQPGHEWLQQFQLEANTVLQGISVRLATYERNDLRGLVTLVLHDAQDRVVARTDVDAATIADNQLVEFYFQGPIELSAGQYAFALSYRPSSDTPMPLTAWSAPHVDEKQLLLVDGVAHSGVMEYVLHTREGLSGNFRRVQTAAGISVFENMKSPNGPYFLPRLAAGADHDSAKMVAIVQYAPSAFTLYYAGLKSGYVVVPMSMTSEWTATIDGKGVDAVLKDGVMPAVPVSGPATIKFEYTSLARRWLLPWSSVLLCILGLMFYFDRKALKRACAGAERST